MALRIDLPHEYLTRALEQAIASLKRSENKGINKLMMDLIRADIAAYTKAMNTITEVK